MSVIYPRKPLNPYKTNHLPSGYYPFLSGYEEDKPEKPSEALPLMDNSQKTFSELVLMNVTPEPVLNGEYTPGIQFNRISSHFGLRDDPTDRKNHKRKQHMGNDYPAPANTEVSAASDGTVIFSYDGIKGYGNTVVIQHPDRGGVPILTLYAHLSADGKLPVGTNVKAGDIIGKVGESNKKVENTTGPHVHVETIIAKGRSRDGKPSFLDSNGVVTRNINSGGRLGNDGKVHLGIDGKQGRVPMEQLPGLVGKIYNKNHPKYKEDKRKKELTDALSDPMVRGPIIGESNTIIPSTTPDTRPQPSTGSTDGDKIVEQILYGYPKEVKDRVKAEVRQSIEADNRNSTPLLRSPADPMAQNPRAGESNMTDGDKIINQLLYDFPKEVRDKARAEARQMGQTDNRNPINPSDTGSPSRSSSSHSGETLESRNGKVWRIEEDGSTRGFVKAWV